MELLCTVARGYDDDAACGRPATARVTVACEHEHLCQDYVCGRCVEGLLSKQMICVACDELPLGAHICPSALVATAAVASGSADATPNHTELVRIAARAHA